MRAWYPGTAHLFRNCATQFDFGDAIRDCINSVLISLQHPRYKAGNITVDRFFVVAIGTALRLGGLRHGTRPVGNAATGSQERRKEFHQRDSYKISARLDFSIS